jgi:hypothetical protein
VNVLPDHVDAFLRAIVKPDQPIGARAVGLLLGVHVATVKRLSIDDLPYFTVVERGDRRYRLEDVRGYIARHRVGPCECRECRCPYPCKPGAERSGRLICWRCKEGRHA